MPNPVYSQQSLPLEQGATLPPMPQPETEPQDEGAQYQPETSNAQPQEQSYPQQAINPIQPSQAQPAPNPNPEGITSYGNTQPTLVNRFRQGLSNFGNNVRNKFYDIGTGIGNFADRFGNSGRARREGRAAKQDRFKQLREARTERDAALEARRSQHRDYGVVGRGISAFARGLGNIWNEGKKAYNDMIYPELPEAMQNTSDVIGGAADLGMHGIKIGAMGLGALARGARKFGNWASDKYQAYKYGRDARNSARERFENERQDWLRNREANRATNPIFQRVQHSARPVVPELPEAYRTGRSTLQKALIDEAIERNRAANPPAPAEVAEAEPQQPSSLRTIANTVGNAALQTAKLPLNAIGAVGRGLYNHFLGDQPEAPAEAPAAPPPTPPVEHELGALDRSRPIEERPVRPPSAIPASEKRFSHSAESNAPRDYSNVYDDRNLRDAFADFDLKF